MKNKPKTNKWVEEIMQLGFDVAMGGDAFKSEEFNRLQQEKNYDKVVKDYSKKIDNLITQTQQETLEWCLKEIELKIGLVDTYTLVEIVALRQLHKTIKQRKENNK